MTSDSSTLMSNGKLIHKTAVISDGAEIHELAEIGPYAVIGANVRIGKGTKIGPHAVIDGHTTIGEDCRIFAGATIGLEPQDLTYKNEPTGVIMGNRVTIREYATIHRGTGDRFTTVGDDCFLMNYTHLAHDCKIGNGVIMANSSMLAGHVQVGDNVVMSGNVVFHQHVRVGRLCMFSALCGTRVDIPPFVMCDQRQATVRGLNIIGMRRQKFAPAVRAAIKEAYRIIYRSGINLSQALSKIESEIEPFPEVKEIVEFCRASKRGIARGFEDGDLEAGGDD